MFFFFFFQAEDGIRDLVRSRGLGDVYKRQILFGPAGHLGVVRADLRLRMGECRDQSLQRGAGICLLYTSDAADERSSVDLGGRRILKKKNTRKQVGGRASIAHKTNRQGKTTTIQ